MVAYFGKKWLLFLRLAHYEKRKNCLAHILYAFLFQLEEKNMINQILLQKPTPLLLKLQCICLLLLLTILFHLCFLWSFSSVFIFWDQIVSNGILADILFIVPKLRQAGILVLTNSVIIQIFYTNKCRRSISEKK